LNIELKSQKLRSKKMKSIVRKTYNKPAFTIVELLTVMSIIVILIGLLVPALNQVKKYAHEVKQRTQLHSIDTAIEFFNSEFNGYPESSATDSTGRPYCGALKLAEAMMGQDLRGFHPDSIFRSDGTDGFKNLYPTAQAVTPAQYKTNISTRKGPYLPLENANAYLLEDIYPDTTPFDPGHFVLCDVFRRVTHRSTGQKIGMPILYYRANTANSMHQQLLMLGMPWNPPPSGPLHKLAVENGQTGVRFYMDTRNDKVTTASIPYRENTYILISAGWDGEYGTPDDICNFDWKYQEMPIN
jgi:type II secretory pathway pseudopilin PulG